MFIRNICIHLPDYKVSQRRRRPQNGCSSQPCDILKSEACSLYGADKQYLTVVIPATDRISLDILTSISKRSSYWQTFYSIHCIFVCYWCNSPQWARASSFTRFLDHIQRRTTVNRTPLDEWSARRRDLYLTTHNTHNRQTSMPPVGFEPKIPAQASGRRPTPWTARPPGPAYSLYSVLYIYICIYIYSYLFI